jgi:hypothetical protein
MHMEIFVNLSKYDGWSKRAFAAKFLTSQKLKIVLFHNSISQSTNELRKPFQYSMNLPATFMTLQKLKKVSGFISQFNFRKYEIY